MKTVRIFRAEEPELIVMKTTGGYELPLAEVLYASGLPAAALNPKRIRDSARAAGQTAKTGRIDARIIARHSAAPRPPTTCSGDEINCKIKSLTVRKRHLTNMRTAEKKPHGTLPG